MEQLRIFEHSEFGKVRTVLQNGEIWFVGKDIASALGYSNPQKAVRVHISNEDRGMNEMDTPSGRQRIVIINESGMYALIFGSKLESAKRFKHWVISEVLPAIRKNGGYGHPDYTQLIMQTATVVCGEMIRQLIPILCDIQGKGTQKTDGVENCRVESRELPEEYIELRFRTACKIETFPEEIIQHVDEMLMKMLRKQEMNFSAISRYCTMQGYPVSQPSVKTYYRRRFQK